MKYTYYRPTPSGTRGFSKDEKDYTCYMDFIPPFTTYKGYYKCDLIPGFPSGHTSLYLGFTLGSLVPCI